MRISIFSTRELIVAAALRTEAWEARSRETNLIETEGYLVVMDEITGVILDLVRPARMMRDGEPAAILRAVSAPIPPAPGPVITTEFVSPQVLGLGLRNTYLFCPLLGL